MAKVLIVDDDLETIKLLETVVQMDGHETEQVQESRNAIQVVESFMPDIVLLDIMMPDINGIAICKLIKSNPHTSKIKVMMVSALSDDGSRKDAQNAGADQFVTKPILPRLFAQQVRDLIAA